MNFSPSRPLKAKRLVADCPCPHHGPSLRHALWIFSATLLCIGSALLSPATTHAADNAQKPRETLVLQGGSAQVTLDLNGGSLGEFRFKDLPVNPLNWAHPSPGETGNRAFGHFLCLDRWGPPSQAEGKNGMPYHGEASHVAWKVTSSTSTPAYHEAVLQAHLPMAGLAVSRRVRLSTTQSVFAVREEIKNVNALGRLLNMVQHPTIGPPFLDESTRVDCNGRRGFAQGNPLPHPEEPSFFWPAALTPDGTQVNLRELSSDPTPNVVSYAIDDAHGWVTATSPTQGLVIGYLWKSSEYPWVSLWRDVRNGKPSARGLEFGSTGLHQPFPILAKVGRIWDRPVYEFLDASESRAKSYTAFLIRVPKDFLGIQTVEVTPSQLVLHERAAKNPRTLSIAVSPDLLP